MNSGGKVAGQIDPKKHRELWEDIEDVLVSPPRRNEKPIPLEKVKAGLIKSGKLSRSYQVALTASAGQSCKD